MDWRADGRTVGLNELWWWVGGGNERCVGGCSLDAVIGFIRLFMDVQYYYHYHRHNKSGVGG